jgi:hypothetical protein
VTARSAAPPRWAARALGLVALALLAPEAMAQAPQPAGDVRTCPMEVAPGTSVKRGFRALGGGLAGEGWDGAGQNATTLNWHVDNATTDFGAAGQRAALIAAMQTWANIVQITFVELPVASQTRMVDWAFVTGNHCSFEGAECGNANCPFDGQGGVLAHAGFPPGLNSLCVNPMPETYAGNVHFDDADPFEQDGGSAAFSMQLIATHELGHALGLQHDTGEGGPHLMRPNFASGDVAQAPSASDIANLASGYALGAGSVVTLEQNGVWVYYGAVAPEQGTYSQPFNTVAEGANGVPPGSTAVTLHIDAGIYPGPVTISQAMFVATTGVVTIGTP